MRGTVLCHTNQALLHIFLSPACMFLKQYSSYNRIIPASRNANFIDGVFFLICKEFSLRTMEIFTRSLYNNIVECFSCNTNCALLCIKYVLLHYLCVLHNFLRR